MPPIPKMRCPVTGAELELRKLKMAGSGPGSPCMLVSGKLWASKTFPTIKEAVAWYKENDGSLLAGAAVHPVKVTSAGFNITEYVVRSPLGWVSLAAYASEQDARAAFGLAKPAEVEVKDDTFKSSPTDGMEPESDDPDPDELLAQAKDLEKKA